MPSSSYQLVLTSSPDGPITAYDVASGTAVARFTGSRSPRRGITVVGKGLIAVCHVSPETEAVSIHLYNWSTSTVFHSFPVPEFVAPLAATVDGGYIFAGGQSGTLYCFSLPNGEMVKSFAAHVTPISCLILTHDGSLVISGSDDGSIVVIPTFHLAHSSTSSSSSPSSNLKPSIFRRLNAHSDSVTAFSTGGGIGNSTLISSSLDNTCKFWNLLDATLLRTIGFPCAILAVAIDSSDSRFFAAGSDGSVYTGPTTAQSRREQAQAHQEVVSWAERHSGPVVSVGLVNQGRNLVSAGEDGSVWMWDIERGEVGVVMKDDNYSDGKIGGSVSVSDMIVASGTQYSNNNHNDDCESGNNDGVSYGLFNEEMVRCMKKMMEVGDVVSVVMEDESRAIDLLESAIAMYERLLELILKEALKGAGKTSQQQEKGK